MQKKRARKPDIVPDIDKKKEPNLFGSKETYLIKMLMSH